MLDDLKLRSIMINKIVVTALVTSAWAVDLKGGEADLARVRGEYPEAVRALEAKFAHVRGKYRLTVSAEPGKKGQVSDVTDVAFALDHGLQKTTTLRPRRGRSMPGSESVRCFQKDLAFVLVRSEGDKRFRLAGTTTKQREPEVFESYLDPFVVAPFSLLGVPIGRLMDQDKIRFTSAEETTHSGVRMLRAECEFGDPPRNKASLLLDPGLLWVVRRAEVRPGVAPNTVITYDIDYQLGPLGEDVPKSVRHVVPNVNSELCEFESIEFEGTPEAEFTLGYYGLADIPVAAEKPSGSSTPWMTAGVSIVAALMIAYWWARRRTRHYA